jgi:hypothetical protein
MANRISQIINGKKSIQIYDLPLFTELLGVSCEQILSAGEICTDKVSRVTNYSIAHSKNPKEWEEYISREDKLILNCDEYCKTVLDYALEFKNYDFIKFLMDKKYIWFDGGDDSKYFTTFGADTSIKRREVGYIDSGLQYELSTNDELRISLISIAADNGDIKMLSELRAREIPHLYYGAHFLSHNIPDFSISFSKTMINHIADSSEKILNYFTDPFEIRDHIKYKDGSNRAHTYLFPFISELLDRLVKIKSPFAKTAIKKAIDYNKQTYKKLCDMITAVKSNELYTLPNLRNAWISDCKYNLSFIDNGHIVIFRGVFVNNSVEGLITNVARVTAKSDSPELRPLIEELNDHYDKIKYLKDHLEEI